MAILILYRDAIMQIAAEKVVSIHYILRSENGEILDRSAPDEPFAYIHGMGQIIPGLENALLGKAAGDRLNVAVAPEDGYGLRSDDMVRVAPLSAFQGVDQVTPGMQFQAETEYGVQLVTVVGVENDEVILDGNHPLAGQALNFEVEITGIRDATTEELDHGHVHGAGGHHHD